MLKRHLCYLLRRSDYSRVMNRQKERWRHDLVEKDGDDLSFRSNDDYLPLPSGMPPAQI